MRSLWLLLCCFIASHVYAKESSKYLTPKVWNGEMLEADEGAFYLQSQIMDKQARERGGSFTFVLKGQKRRLTYLFQSRASDLNQQPETVWKIKTDEYDILRIQFMDDDGRSWQWSGPYRFPLKVQKAALSHFGVWYLIQLKQNFQLGLLIKKGKNVFPAPKALGRFQRVIDGENGATLLHLKQEEKEKPMQIRQVMRSSYTVGMFYTLNLYRQNIHAPAMARVFEANDADIRSCYLDYLERSPGVQGELNYSFVYSAESQSIRSLKIKHSEFKDERFLECMTLKVMGLSFPVTTSLIGDLDFDFQLSP